MQAKMLIEELAARIKQLEMTQEVFASFIGVDPANLSRILTGKVCPSLKMFFRIYGGLNFMLEQQELNKTIENESNNPV